MASKSEKKYRQIKRAHIGVSIFEFCLFMIASTIMLVCAVQQTTLYVMDTKLSSEYERISALARLYDKARDADDAAIYGLLDDEDCDYIVTDKAGRVVRQKGSNTCGSESGRVLLTAEGKWITAYRDTERDYIFPSKNERIGLDIIRFREWLSSEEDEEEKELDLDSPRERFINLPIWLSVDVAGGEEHFIGKAVFSANRRDVFMITSFIVGIIALIIIILITMLVSAIRSVLRQRRMISLYFSDIVTGGHNWTWFLVMGERFLRKRRNAKYSFAVVSYVMVNYRNYCLCHSLAEGEKLLCNIYNRICASIDGKEMCAHATSADFALLLKYESEQELKERLQRLTEELSVISEDHIFSFQAGVSLLNRDKGRDGSPAGYRETDLDTEYNNAASARMTLADSEDSGIAFFDEALKKEQEWLDTVQERQRRALDNEEFMVYYQPKYDPKTDTLKGAEALIRWNSPEFGLVPPGRFIPIFEKNGFITKIDHYMIRHVAADQKRWLDKGYKCVPVSVNVSRAHFIESNLAEQIRDMVDEAGAPHEL
ncbi:MAG TPA: hypothetical protein DCL38_08205, partial [Lachnospiraceae bacterium]|nr:hypothetical protein [Lachnospiraceae bacterium]